jgi:Domain of unknown function (DUF4232)
MRSRPTGSASVAALAVAIALAACGGSGSGGGAGGGAGGGGGSGQATQASQPAAATAGPTGTSPAATASQPATTTSASSSSAGTATAGQSGAAQPNGGASVGAPASECRAAGLALSYLGGQGATGHGELGFALKNTGQACGTGGYPGIQFLAKDGSALPTTPQHTTSDFFGDLPLQHVALAPGQAASFRLGVSHGSGSDAGCHTAYGLQVIAPNDTATLRVTIPDGASECGTTTVSPLQPGNSAYQ